MENNIKNYNSLLNELYIFYNQIKNYVLLYFEEKNEKLRQLTVTRINAYSRDYWSNRN